MPRGGLKCPDCGYRFKVRRYKEDGSYTSDLIPEESTDKEKAFMCPGNGGKGKHVPHIVKIMRINAGTPQELVKLKIISAGTAELMEEYQDAWREANKAKYRPDLIFR